MKGSYVFDPHYGKPMWCPKLGTYGFSIYHGKPMYTKKCK